MQIEKNIKVKGKQYRVYISNNRVNVITNDKQPYRVIRNLRADKYKNIDKTIRTILTTL